LLPDRQGGAASCSTAVGHGVQSFVAAARVVAVGSARGRVGFALVAVVSSSSFASQNPSASRVELTHHAASTSSDTAAPVLGGKEVDSFHLPTSTCALVMSCPATGCPTPTGVYHRWYRGLQCHFRQQATLNSSRSGRAWSAPEPHQGKGYENDSFIFGPSVLLMPIFSPRRFSSVEKSLI
jgi:hypothetical protein